MCKEIPDIAQWEETDSELAKKNILKLSSSIKYHIDFNKKLINEINRLEMIIDIKTKRINELNKRLDKKGKRIDKAIKEIEYFELKANHLDDAIYLDEELSNRLLDILRGKDNENEQRKIK